MATDEELGTERAIRASLGLAGPAFLGRFGRLTPVQVAAIPPLLDGRDALVSAPTAGGKTEAVAAPLAARHLSARGAGLSLLYVCPTRALVNDLYRRLATPLESLGIELGAKTSDHPVTAHDPLAPWLITTPESLDSLLVRRPRDLVGVTALVLDEIHLLDGTPRGDQLRMLMARLSRLRRAAVERGDRDARAGFQTVLISATAAEPAALASAFAPAAVQITVAGTRSILTLGTRLASVQTLCEALRAIPRREAAKLLVFTRSRADCEEVAAALTGRAPYGRDVFAHHGSLSRRARMAAESAFHHAAQAVFVATTTLELGIDIGDIDWVVQFGPPQSVKSFLQQIGRGCRRQKDVTRVLAIARSAAEEVLFEVILSLARQGKIERPTRVFAASVLVQQVASYLLQRSSGTVGRPEILELVGGQTDAADLDLVLGAMAERALLIAARGGRFAAGPELERWFESQPRKLHTNLGQARDTLAIFDAETHEHLGEVQRSGLPAAGRVAFGGRSGTLTTATDGRAYLARGGAGEATAPSYWTVRSPMSAELASAIREHLGIPEDVVPLVPLGPDAVAVFPFLGGAGTRALAAHLRLRGAKVRGGTDVAIVLRAPPGVEQLRLDDTTLAAAVATCWKSLERLQEPGAHAGVVPDGVRRRQVTDRLIASGVARAAAAFRELRPFEGPAAEVLAHFARS